MFTILQDIEPIIKWSKILKSLSFWLFGKVKLYQMLKKESKRSCRFLMNNFPNVSLHSSRWGAQSTFRIHMLFQVAFSRDMFMDIGRNILDWSIQIVHPNSLTKPIRIVTLPSEIIIVYVRNAFICTIANYD